MRIFTRNRFSLGCIGLAALSIQAAACAGTTSYFVHQSGDVTIDSRTSNTLPSDGTYNFNLIATDEPSALRSQAMVDVHVIPPAGDVFTFQSTKVFAESQSSLVDTAMVQGPDGVPGGTVVFTWEVRGETTLSFDSTTELAVESNSFDVNTLSARAKFTAIVDGMPVEFVDSSHDAPFTTSSKETFSDTVDGVSAPLIWNVSTNWQAGQPISIYFDLTSTVELDVAGTNGNGAEFKAILNSDYSHTARLIDVQILRELEDGRMERLDAELISQDLMTGQAYPLTNVPEPSSFLLVFVGVIGFLVRSRLLLCCRKN